MKLQTIRLVTVVAPAVFLGLAAYAALFLGTDFLQTPAGFALLLLGLTAATFAFSTFAFRVIDRLEARIVEQNRQLVVLARIASSTTESLDLRRLLNLALDEVLDVTESEAGAICLLDADAEELVAACYRGISDELAVQIRRQKLGVEPIGTEAVRSGKPVLVDQIFAGPETREMFDREGFHSVLSVPLKADNEVSGVIGIATRRDGSYSREQIDLLVNIATQLSLAVRNSLLLAKTNQRNHELGALLAVGRAASSSLDLNALLDEALGSIQSVTSADGVEVWLKSADDGLDLARQSGFGSLNGAVVNRLGPGQGLPGLVITSGAPLVIDDLDSEAGPHRQAVCRAGFRAYSAFPIRSRGEMLGVLGVASKQPGSLSSRGFSRLLVGVAEQLAVALENAQLHGRVLDVAVVEERERIARELHDGLAQVLGYINTQTMATRRLMEVGRAEEACQQLRLMEDAARSTYADVREAIVGLSSPLPAQHGLVEAVRTYVAQFARMVPFEVQVLAGPDIATARLPAAYEIQAMRIVQEALSNVRKHANAMNVSILFTPAADGLRVEITDDGAGFKSARPGSGGWPRFGIQSMKERAHSIGGSLDINSLPGQGTVVTLRVPQAEVVGGVVDARSTG